MPPPICRIALDSDDIPEDQLMQSFAGISRLSGKVLPHFHLALPRSGMIRLAARVASRRDKQLVAPDTIAVGSAELRKQLSFTNRFLLYIFPTWILALLTRIVAGDTLRTIVPPRSIVFGPDPVRFVRVREDLTLQLGGAERRGQVIATSGMVEVVLRFDARDTRRVMQRNSKVARPIEAGCLLMQPTTKAVWPKVSDPDFNLDGCLHATSPLVLTIGDLRSDPEIQELERVGERYSSETAGIREIHCRLPFQLPSLSVDSRFAEMLIVSLGVLPDGDPDQLLIAVSLDPDVEQYGLGSFHLRHVEIRFPEIYPPPRGIQVTRGQNRAGRRPDVVRIPDTGSTATIDLTDDVSLTPGKSLGIEVRFHSDIDGIVRYGGIAEMELQFNYDTPIGLRGKMVLTHPGGRARMLLEVEAGQLSLRAHVGIDLAGIRFRERGRAAYKVEADRNYTVSMSEILRLSAILADEQIIVRHILQAPPPGYPERGGFACDLHARAESTLGGPDIHIRVVRETPATRTESPPVRFEVTAFGRSTHDQYCDDVDSVAEIVRRVLLRLIGTGGTDSASTNMSLSQSPEQPASSEPGPEPSTDYFADRLESLAERFERGLDRLSQLVGAMRPGGGRN